MWIIVGHKKNEYQTFQRELLSLCDKDLKMYCPKIQLKKKIGNKYLNHEKKILGNYVLCYHPNFKKNEIINKLKYLKGLSFVLEGYASAQKNIINFFEYCKSCENSEGYLMQKFFDISKLKKGIFLNGPFATLLFQTIEKQKNKIKVLIGQKTAVININKLSNFLYQPI